MTGGLGMLGSSFKNIKTDHELILIGRDQADLLDFEQCHDVLSLYKPDAVIHLAAKVGGVKGNTDFVSDFYSQNIRINTNVLDVCKNLKIKKVLSLLSTCIYPDKTEYPLLESRIHDGPPHESNFGYAYAKRMLDIQTKAIRNQYGLDYSCAVPNNLYGPNDNFDLEGGHVIPSLIRKIWESKMNKTTPVFWGSGKPLREFTYSEDISDILIKLLETPHVQTPINIGNTNEVSIREVVNMLCQILDYDKEIVWDIEKPEGQFRKPSSNQKLFLTIGEYNYTPLKEGLEKTCKWFLENYPNVRGIR